MQIRLMETRVLDRTRRGHMYLRDIGQSQEAVISKWNRFPPSQVNGGRASDHLQHYMAKVGVVSSNLGSTVVEAVVVHGEKLGRTLGFPTANMVLPPDVELRPGVHAVLFRFQDGNVYSGVSCFGVRPTIVENGASILETTLFDFNGDLYGQTCSVLFIDFIRPEIKFDGLSSLVAQMARDAEDARNRICKDALLYVRADLD